MKLFSFYLNKVLFILVFLVISFGGLSAQGISPSPYSDQNFDPLRDAAWWERPIVWLGLLVFLIGFRVLYKWKKRKRSSATAHLHAKYKKELLRQEKSDERAREV